SNAEASAAARAIQTHKIAVGRPERRDSTVTVGVAKPIMVTEKGAARSEAAVVFRADLNRTITPTPTAVASAASAARGVSAPMPVIVLTIGGALDAVSVCGVSTQRICIVPIPDP